jgi:hypothetical protein
MSQGQLSIGRHNPKWETQDAAASPKDQHCRPAVVKQKNVGIGRDEEDSLRHT